MFSCRMAGSTNRATSIRLFTQPSSTQRTPGDTQGSRIPSRRLIPAIPNPVSSSKARSRRFSHTLPPARLTTIDIQDPQEPTEYSSRGIPMFPAWSYDKMLGWNSQRNRSLSRKACPCHHGQASPKFSQNSFSLRKPFLKTVLNPFFPKVVSRSKVWGFIRTIILESLNAQQYHRGVSTRVHKYSIPTGK